MGIVYRCRDLATGADVALKRVIPPEGKLAGEYVMWFYKEARALAALDHPAIVGARDFGQLADGTPYLAMELAPGASLHDLGAVRLSYPILWEIVDQILGALAHAHARGVVHGDLKPSNVLVEERPGAAPVARILDFGLAWLKRDRHDERLDGSKAMEFAPHAGAGTPGYMAPEQIQHESHHVAGPTDLYALGCILYKLLTGQAPFSGDAKELLRKHAFDRVPEPQLVVATPAGVDQFLLRLLARRPWERWEYAGNARADWQAFRPDPTDALAWRFPTLPRGATIPPPAAPAAAGESEGSPAAADRAPGLLSIRESPLVGRDDIRRVLLDLCQEVIEARGKPHRLVLLVGQAGVGKSRIAEWLCETMHERGSMVPLRARYRPMRAALDGMLGAVVQHYGFERADRDIIEKSLLARWRIAKDDKNGCAWVAGAAEWIRPMPPGEQHRLGPTGIRFTLDSLETRRMVIRYTLRKIAHGRPLVFWLDDLHHGTAGTFEGLKRIHDEEPDQRIVMVATVRAEDVQIGTTAADRLRDLRERMDGLVLDVQPMEPEATAELVRASLPLDDAAVGEAVRRSRGNPLFALQQLHAWALAGDIRLEGGAYRVPADVLALRPQTTAELWDGRVAALPPEHRIAAHAAAALGGDMRRQVLAALLSELGVARGALVSLQSAEILLPRGPERFGWPHALLQEHLLAQLVASPEAPRIFEAAADALLHHPLANTRRVVRQRVQSLLSAGQAERAATVLFTHLEEAWNGAREPHASLADLDLLKGRVEGPLLALKHRWQAESLRHLGRTDEAITHAEIARASFEEFSEPEELASCLRLLGHLSSEKGQSIEGLEMVRQARALFEAAGNVLGQAQCAAVEGEIEYLLGHHENARRVIEVGAAHFAELDQPLGRGQCLLLLSWIDHAEGAIARARRRTAAARAEFERAGYRLGLAQADASAAHLEHRLQNYYGAERGACEALGAFESLRTPRGHAACERLLAMIALDTDDLDTAELHARKSLAVFGSMGDPWGIVESKLLLAQIALGRRDAAGAEALLTEARALDVQEVEPRQHLLVTRAWAQHVAGDADAALEALEAASDVFDERTRVGDHVPHLLDRLSRLAWPPHVASRIDAWRALLNDRSRRNLE